MFIFIKIQTFISIEGGKGNHFFSTNNEKAPEVCEYGAKGENTAYVLELRSMAHLGLVSFAHYFSLFFYFVKETL